jgi:phage gp36-like protein
MLVGGSNPSTGPLYPSIRERSIFDMTQYATIADMRARIDDHILIQLTDTAQLGVIDEGALQRAINQAANTVQGYVAAYYAPVDANEAVPDLLIDLTCDIAYVRLYRGSNPPEHVEKKHKDAVAMLRDIAKGLIKIDQGAEVLPERDGMILTSGDPRLFTRTTMADG